ncbi:tyrosine-protein kinase hopscotch [Condylostylus longicornis]|uniref:tyrosine-protein kinase hopscotch n=1 Tax=Condylostylus longicornis TaxID=2530218 RepID=UPI00244DE030|nr:tyrosine-protein kinase hopscotch [Condylostylus longicornis]
MAMMKSLIFNYKLKEFREVSYPIEFKSEDVCLILCKENRILPTVRVLFQLRICDTEHWIPPGEPLKPYTKYEFRIRFRIPELISLKKLDEITYDYFYHQARFDMVMGKIDEIKYPTHKDRVLGICVVDTYIDMIEKCMSIEDIEKNYKKYIPKELLKIHKLFAKRKLFAGLRHIKESSHDLFYVKGSYLNTIYDMAPNYLIEQYEGRANYLPEDNFKDGRCPVLIEFNPHHESEPGLRVFYRYKGKWRHIVKIDQIYVISKSFAQQENCVRLEVGDLPNGYTLEFFNSNDRDSFITCVAGYYRLMVRWNTDLCFEFKTPSLTELKELKCHGPVGGDFSYGQIREKNNNPGSYIIRQSEREYDTYYIDINTRIAHTETLKITRDSKKWYLHSQETKRPFEKLTDLALSIETNSDKFRIPPSDYDQTPLLLICLPKSQIKAKKAVDESLKEELQRKRVQVFDPKIDLCVYQNTAKDCEGGMMEEMKADWVLVNQHLKVTLKILKSERHVADFMKLANTWGKMYSHEFLKLYGITLSTPYAMIMEYAKSGPLNEFLQRNTNIPLICLLNIVHTLVRAIVYLQENKFFHGFIRCCNLQVIKYDAKTNEIVVKLADPGFPKKYTRKDLPWIPLNYHNDLERAKKDLSSEFWAFATVLWEIFSYGAPVDLFDTNGLQRNLRETGSILPLPENCPEDMKITIMDGYCLDPEQRFNRQLIFSRLSAIKEENYSNYDTPLTETTSLDTQSTRSSEGSRTTGQTTCDNCSEPSSCSDFSTCDRIPLIHNSRQRHNSHNGCVNQFNGFPTSASYFADTPLATQLSDGSTVVQYEKIGEGHYGTVYRGVIHYSHNRGSKKVAIKTLKPDFHKHLSEDFEREINIMKSLDHPNIVKILKWNKRPQISIIMEFVECGSFIIYLSSQKPNLTNDILLNFALDIANGMHYLREKKIIHRDLAARNILVDNDCVKISDFGLAQYADSEGYYLVKSDRAIPIIWYAPETIRTNKFSFQSDVWSYGVTLFEMFSRGEKPNLIPNKEVNQAEFLNLLEIGQRLPKPIICPDSVYEQLMRPCWYANPKERPTFKDIIETIKRLQNENGEFLT